jgi:hypothetical protein
MERTVTSISHPIGVLLPMLMICETWRWESERRSLPRQALVPMKTGKDTVTNQRLRALVGMGNEAAGDPKNVWKKADDGNHLRRLGVTEVDIVRATKGDTMTDDPKKRFVLFFANYLL